MARGARAPDAGAGAHSAIAETIEPPRSPLARELAAWLGARRKVAFAYPGVWLRDDVWATHGHYLDRLITIPTFERIAAGGMARVVGRPARAGGGQRRPRRIRGRAGADVRVARPARQRARRGRALGQRRRDGEGLVAAVGRRPRAAARQGAGRAAAARDRRAQPRRARARASRRSTPTSCAAPASPRWAASSRLLGVRGRRTSSSATRTAPGRWPGWIPASGASRRGTQLVNTGCWTDEPRINTHDPRSPYRPGYGVLVEDEGPPRLVRITENLGERPEHTF